MNGGEKLGAVVVVCISVVIIVLIMGIRSYWLERHGIILQMVQEGADPVAAHCAIEDVMGNDPTCIIYIQKVTP